MNILDITILNTSASRVLARADVHFEGNHVRDEGFHVKGFKIFRDEKTGKEYVTPPSYLAGKYWRPLFRLDSADEWHTLQAQIIEAYNNKLIEESMKENNMH